MKQSQIKSKEDHDRKGVEERYFSEGERILVKNTYPNKDVRFVPGIVVKRLGSLWYLVSTGHGTRRTHVDHIRKTSQAISAAATEEKIVSHYRSLPSAPKPDVEPCPRIIAERPDKDDLCNQSEIPTMEDNPQLKDSADASVGDAKQPELPPSDEDISLDERRYPRRERKLPVKLKNYEI